MLGIRQPKRSSPIGWNESGGEVNGAPHEPLAPFGGFKQPGTGREYGVFGLDALLEPRVVPI
ncbi:hypothetical protein [Rhizobium terrae]|uniref:hypothetical protein n=1 Tax=Rhizobium terrae TaxID=2171756 RepID=UPI0013C2C935|nr:hypothetical protein [Rhizobium terrae]